MVTGCKARDDGSGTARYADGGRQRGTPRRTVVRGQKTENSNGAHEDKCAQRQRRQSGDSGVLATKVAWRRKGQKDNSPGMRRPYIQLAASPGNSPPGSSPCPSSVAEFSRGILKNDSDPPPHSWSTAASGGSPPRSSSTLVTAFGDLPLRISVHAGEPDLHVRHAAALVVRMMIAQSRDVC